MLRNWLSSFYVIYHVLWLWMGLGMWMWLMILSSLTGDWGCDCGCWVTPMVWGWPMTWLCTSVGSCVTVSCATLRLCQSLCDCVCSCNGVTVSEPVRGYYTGMSLWMWFLCVVGAWLWMRIELWVCMWNFGCAYGYIPMWLCVGGVSMTAWGRRLMINGANIAVNP